MSGDARPIPGIVDLETIVRTSLIESTLITTGQKIMADTKAKEELEFNFKHTVPKRIPVALIRENTEALRVSVDKTKPEYQELVDSVRKRGVMNAILVREIKDPATGGTLYGLIDGLHRYNAAMDAGLDEINASVGSLDDGDMLEAQILANVHKIETKAAQYSKALIKILGANPLLTIEELAGRLSRSPKWLRERLGLVKLNKDIQEKVDDNTLGLTNAYALAKLSPAKQAELLNSALAKSPAEFVAQAENVRKEEAKAKREGRPAVATFQPSERLQKLGLIKAERAILDTNPAESSIVKAAKANGVTTIEQMAAYFANWVLHLDPVSIAADKAAYDAEKAQQKADADRKKQIRERAKELAEQEVTA